MHIPAPGHLHLQFLLLSQRSNLRHLQGTDYRNPWKVGNECPLELSGHQPRCGLRAWGGELWAWGAPGEGSEGWSWALKN